MHSLAAATLCRYWNTSAYERPSEPHMRYPTSRRIVSRLTVAAAPILRLIAAVFLLAAIIAAVANVTLGQGAVSTATYWQQLAPQSYANAGRVVAATLGAWAWDPVMSTLLGLPAYVLFAILSLAAGIAGRRRRRVEVFLN